MSWEIKLLPKRFFCKLAKWWDLFNKSFAGNQEPLAGKWRQTPGKVSRNQRQGLGMQDHYLPTNSHSKSRRCVKSGLQIHALEDPRKQTRQIFCNLPVCVRTVGPHMGLSTKPKQTSCIKWTWWPRRPRKGSAPSSAQWPWLPSTQAPAKQMWRQERAFFFSFIPDRVLAANWRLVHMYALQALIVPTKVGGGGAR